MGIPVSRYHGRFMPLNLLYLERPGSVRSVTAPPGGRRAARPRWPDSDTVQAAAGQAVRASCGSRRRARRPSKGKAAPQNGVHGGGSVLSVFKILIFLETVHFCNAINAAQKFPKALLDTW